MRSAAPFLERDHHVAGIVGEEVAIDADNVGMHKARQGLGLGDEAIEPPAKVLRAPLRAWRRVDGAQAGGEIGREIFLDRDQATERQFLGQIGDAEPPGTKHALDSVVADELGPVRQGEKVATDRKSTRLNSSHGSISYAVFCLKKK